MLSVDVASQVKATQVIADSDWTCGELIRGQSSQKLVVKIVGRGIWQLLKAELRTGNEN